jgi:hypothetical protein
MNKPAQYRVQWQQSYSHWPQPVNTEPQAQTPTAEALALELTREILDRIRNKRT